MEPTTFLVMLVLGLAMFVQSGIGFGLALVSMPLLVSIIGLQQATPVVALFAVVAEIFVLLRYRESMSFRAVWPLIVASLIGIPVGVYLLSTLDPTLITMLLGVLLVAYALYALIGMQLPTLSRPSWGFLFGFAAGVLSGAYNTGGPPAIIYGNMRRWSPLEFKGNMQAFFIVGSTALLITHLLAGNITMQTVNYVLWSIPAAAVGMVLGFMLDRYISVDLFRKGVLVLLTVLGLHLIFGS